MKKEEMLEFINRYHLGGKIESAVWSFEGDELTTKFRSPDKSFMGIISKKDFGFSENCQLGVLTTGQLVMLLKVLGDEFDFALNKQSANDEEKIVSITLSNKKTRINFMLADLTVIPKAKGIKNEPEYDLSMTIDTDFIDLFIKSKGALPETRSFTLVNNKKTGEYEVVIGYSATNSNCIYIPVTVTTTVEGYELDRPISFSAEYFKEVLSANKNAETFKFEVSVQGISHTIIKDGDYSIDYYLAETQTDI